MKNKGGNVAVFTIIIVIVAITTGVVGWMFAKKSQAPVRQATVIQPTAPVAQTQPSVIKDVQENKETIPALDGSILNEKMKNEIVNWSNYKQFDNSETSPSGPVFGIEGCSNDKAMADYKLFIEKANRDVKKFELAKFDSRFGIDLYITPNYNKVENYKPNCSGGLGAIYPIATYKDNILWGYLACSAGAAPDGDDAFDSCEKLAGELRTYFKL